jgi:hypothetical protein
MWDFISVILSLMILMVLFEIFISPFGFLKKVRAALKGETDPEDLESCVDINGIEKRLEAVEARLVELERRHKEDSKFVQ